jgi:hypothetical protein
MADEEKFRRPVQYDGIGPFPMTSYDEQGFMMEWSKYRFPHKRYQDAEPLSVSPLIWSGEIAFLNGVEGYEDLWPFKFMQMRRRCQLPRNGYLRHPLYGDIFGHFSRFDPQYRTTTLNGCMVQYTFEQVIDPNRNQVDIVNDNPLAGAKQNAAVVQAAVDQLAAPPAKRTNVITGESVVDEVIVGIAQADSLLQSPPPAPIDFPTFPSAGIIAVANKLPPFTELVDGFDQFLTDQRNSFDDIAAEADRVNQRYDELLICPELLLPENAEVLLAATASQAEVQRAALEAQEKAARVVEMSIDRKMTAPEIALFLYEDPDRCDEIMRLNPLDLEEYPYGYTIRFLDL